MKRSLLTIAAILTVSLLWGQRLIGPEEISYFQAPAEGVKFARADVYISHDEQLEQAKLEAQQEKNSAMGSKFGALGEAVANTANKGLSMVKKMEAAVREFEDEKGRFAVWSFVPSYIIADAETNDAVMVEIFVMNERNPDPLAKMPTEPDKDGFFDVPYYVNCRYKVMDPRGNVILEENLGVLQGTQKTKDYTPPEPAAMGSITVSEDENEGLSAAEKIGVNKAYNKVRQQVYARFGFGQFTAPIKLGKIKKIKAARKMTGDIIEIFENKKGLLLSKDDKEKVRKFVDIIEKDIDKTKEKNRWVAYHNLSVCYAWLEEPAKAKNYYAKYAEEISETLEKMRKWNLLLAGKLPKEERKGVFIGMKDQKKYEQYNNINSFVNFYPAGAKRYEKLFYTINRNLAQFTDYYAHNDLLCQLFEIDYPFQFLPLNAFEGEPKKMEGTLTKEGSEPVEFDIDFDRKRRIRVINVKQTMLDEEGKKQKLVTKPIRPQYCEESGDYLGISSGNLWNESVNYSMNYVYDPLEAATEGVADDITKGGGFLDGRTSNEEVRLRVDLDGNIYFKGESDYFKMNAIFKDMLVSNGLEAKRADTKSTFNTLATINENGILTNWSWDGSTTTNFAGLLSHRTQRFTADKMKREVSFAEVDKHGNPTKLNYKFHLKGELDVESSVSVKEFFANYYENNGRANGDVSTAGFDIQKDEVWECEFKYDEQGNWIEMKVGPYIAKRSFKY